MDSESVHLEADRFASAIIIGIVGAGLPSNAAAKIADRLIERLRTGSTGSELYPVLMNPAKVGSAEVVWARRHEFLASYRASADKIAWLVRIKGIGPKTAPKLAESIG